MTLDESPQVDWLGQKLVHLLREIHHGQKTGRYIIDINAHDGDLSRTTIANPQRINMPADIRSRNK